MLFIFNFLKWYKKKKRQKYEKEIQNHIDFNNYQTNSYKIYPNEPKNIIQKYRRSKNGWAICQCYGIKTLNKIYDRYNVSQELIDEVIETEKECLLEYHNMKDRIKKEKQLSEEREKIRLYKKAILELKNEGKI